MPLPDLIEIIPLAAPVRAEITVPGSKSITNRALILAALAEGVVTLKGALWSEDTQIMTEALRKLGFEIRVEPGPDEFCNRTITVKGLGGKIPNAGTAAQPLELFVGNAGTAARFLAAFVCLGAGVYRLSGVPRMHERPQAALFVALRELGYRVEAEKGNDHLPVKIWGTSEKTAAERRCKVSIAASSQFASALLLSARQGGWQVEIVDDNEEESPYVTMTAKLMAKFPWHGGEFQIEPDASSGSYFWGAALMTYSIATDLPYLPEGKPNIPSNYINIAKKISVKNWPDTGWQMDERFMYFSILGSRLLKKFRKDYPEGEVSRRFDLGDSIMTAIVLAPLPHWCHQKPFIKFTDLGRLRVQECERVVALRTELTKCGAKVIEEGDTLTVYPSALHGAEIETYNDHRMAMCFAVLGLKVPGIRLKNPSCVKKTFPNFFQKLAAPPPGGLGAEIWAVQNGQRIRRLAGDDLFAG